MEYRKLGKTDISVSVVAMGCWSLVGGQYWGRQEEAESLATIRAALDAGVNFFDTAEAYGDGVSELVLGKALAGCRQEVVIASKASPSHLSSAEIGRACEGSLRRLNTDYIDLYQIHWPNPAVPISETTEALDKLKRQGKVRAIGVSNFGVQDLGDILANGACQANQLPYNLLWRAIEYEIMEACKEHDVGILAYSPFAQGLLTGKFRTADEVPEGRARTRHFSKDRPFTRHSEGGHEGEVFTTIDGIRRICEEFQQPMARVAFAWVLRQPGIVSVLAGARRPDQINQSVRAADLELPSQVIAELNEATDGLKLNMGRNPDMWQSESRFR
jgi:aryl-alcohol dehydrogenase-like predicted oxidoreductase